MNKLILKFKRAARFFVDEITEKKPYLGNKHFCPGCNTGVAYFKPFHIDYLKQLERYDYVHSLFSAETGNWAGYECPNCGINDRDRLYIMYFNKAFASIDKSVKRNFIDFAPSKASTKYLKALEFLNYRTADLMAEGVDDRVDITDMQIYKEGQFDFFLCSHILEHVEDDSKALSELYRILKPGGWGIAMAPVNLHLKADIEDVNISSAEDRWKFYGQNDHVRMYSKPGFLSKLKAPGFIVHQFDINYFGEQAFELHGINRKSVLYVVEKPQK